MRVSRFSTGVGLILYTLLVAAIPTVAAKAQSCAHAVDLRQLMTVAAFDKAGLNQLNRGQITALNAWLSRNGDELCPVPVTGKGNASSVCPRPVDLRDFMTVSAFEQAGLTQLDQNQIAALNGWLRDNVRSFCSVAAPPAPVAVPPSSRTGTAAFGAPPVHVKTPNLIESRIAGDFHGWTGNTVFRLENGQIWEQAGPGYFQIDLESPKVVIKKLLIGYVLMVDGYAKEVFVRRIQ